MDAKTDQNGVRDLSAPPFFYCLRSSCGFRPPLGRQRGPFWALLGLTWEPVWGPTSAYLALLGTLGREASCLAFLGGLHVRYYVHWSLHPRPYTHTHSRSHVYTHTYIYTYLHTHTHYTPMSGLRRVGTREAYRNFIRLSNMLCSMMQ